MEFFIPSLFIMLLAAFIIIAFIIRTPNSVLLGVAIIFLILTLYAHSITFGEEYKYVNLFYIASESGTTPYLISGLMGSLLIGYFLYLFSENKLPSLPSMPASMPSAQSATNYLTRGINNGLSSLGVPSSNSYTAPSQSPNQGKNYLASAVNYRV